MKTRKILSILLCAIMVMAVIPVSVLMASAEDANKRYAVISRPRSRAACGASASSQPENRSRE